MATIEFNWKPTNRQLRQFGAVSLIGLPFVAFMLSGRPSPASWQPLHTNVIGGAATVGLLIAIIGWFKPQAIRHIFILACLLAFPIGLVIGEAVLLFIFLFLFTPIALFFRFIGRDELQRTIDRHGKTYWQSKKSAPNVESYFRQS